MMNFMNFMRVALSSLVKSKMVTNTADSSMLLKASVANWLKLKCGTQN